MTLSELRNSKLCFAALSFDPSCVDDDEYIQDITELLLKMAKGKFLIRKVVLLPGEDRLINYMPYLAVLDA